MKLRLIEVGLDVGALHYTLEVALDKIVFDPGGIG